MTSLSRKILGVVAALMLVASACGSDEGVGTAAPADAPTVAVTTNILGDVVENLVGDQMNVVTIMPVGADPHDFQASAQQVAAIGEADALIVNGENFEEGLLDVIETAEADGVEVYEAMSTVATIEFGEGGHDDHGHDDHEGEEDHDEHEGEEDHDEHEGEEDHDEHEHEEGEEHKDEEDHDEHEHEEGEEHKDEEDHDEHEHEEGEEHKDEEDHDEHEGEEDHDEHEGEEDHDEHDDHGDEDGHEGHDHAGDDPHFFTDPARMAVAAEGITDFLIEHVEGIDADALRSSADTYISELTAVDGEVEETLSSLTDEQRVLVTNHEVFGYFADRYDFEVVGAVIPSGSTNEGASAQAIAELAEVIEHEGVPAIFADTSSSDELAQTLADEVGSVEVVELFSESLGDADSGGGTYLEMVRTNAERIAEALAA